MLLLTAFPRPAHAYLDPGTGSMVIQAVIGLVAGTLMLVKIYWKKLVEFFSAKGKKSGRS